MRGSHAYEGTRRLRAIRSRCCFPVVTLALWLPACSDGTGPSERSAVRGDTAVVTSMVGQLEQTLWLVPAEPAPGDTLRIRSVVGNLGTLPVETETRWCGLDLAGDLRLAWPPGWARCGAYSRGDELAHEDSVVEHEWGIVESPPGNYRLRVRHLLKPEHWAEVEVRVRAPEPVLQR